MKPPFKIQLFFAALFGLAVMVFWQKAGLDLSLAKKEQESEFSGELWVESSSPKGDGETVLVDQRDDLVSSERVSSRQEGDTLLEEMLVKDELADDATDVERMMSSDELRSSNRFSSILSRDPAVIDDEYVRFEHSLFELALEYEEGGTYPTIAVELAGEGTVLLGVKSHRKMGTTKGVFSGRLVGSDGGEFLLSYSGEAEAGYVRIDGGGEYRIRYAGDGYHQIARMDPAKVPSCGTL